MAVVRRSDMPARAGRQRVQLFHRAGRTAAGGQEGAVGAFRKGIQELVGDYQ